MGDYSYLDENPKKGGASGPTLLGIDMASGPDRTAWFHWPPQREITVTLDHDDPRLIANIQKAIAESDPACCIKIVVSRGTKEAPPPAQQSESPKPNPHEGLHRAIRSVPRPSDQRTCDR